MPPDPEFIDLLRADVRRCKTLAAVHAMIAEDLDRRGDHLAVVDKDASASSEAVEMTILESGLSEERVSHAMEILKRIALLDLLRADVRRCKTLAAVHAMMADDFERCGDHLAAFVDKAASANEEAMMPILQEAVGINEELALRTRHAAEIIQRATDNAAL
jgi:hypothetical protein